MDNKLELSVIIPTYNEERNVKGLIDRVHTSLVSKNITYEIIVIDDYSTDDTRDVIENLDPKYTVRWFYKRGRKGKAFSLKEGIEKSRYSNICMIDADLQYPPESIPKMLKSLDTADIVVANRKKYQENFFRKFISFGLKKFLYKWLFNFDIDVQSGLKVFKKRVWDQIEYAPSSAWAFDLEFIWRSKYFGFKIINHDITFSPRSYGDSKVSLIRAIWEIGLNIIYVKLHPIPPVTIDPTSDSKMRDAGVRVNNKKYITHTTLPYHASALKTFHVDQKVVILFILIWLAMGLYFNALHAMLIIVAILSFIYFVDVLFNLYLVWKSLNYSKEITYTDDEIRAINDKTLPVYTILCPLYKESHVVPQFTKAISRLDWPKDKLEAILLLEEDDKQTIEAVNKMELPSYIRSVIVPDSQPKTKPKACNYGLSHANGEYLVIYDAEDIPDPLQLKKAYLGFKKTGKKTICLQAKLNYYNPNHNLLTRLFTAEYSLWFDVALIGMQSLNTSLPLGGTSNHFRVSDLHRLQGWDPFNVTEDADLGVRLFKHGYKTAIIDSTTLEEANSKFGNWIRQRSRWIKGYMQTYLVHVRDLYSFTKKYGIHALYFHLTIGSKIAFILINPLLWITTISYFSFYDIVGSQIESVYPQFVFYMAVTSLVFGNFLSVYYYMIGVLKRRHYGLIKYIFLTPFYWILISTAGYIALFQLIFRPHYWEKTVHGFHLNSDIKPVPDAQPAMAQAIPVKPSKTVAAISNIFNEIQLQSNKISKSIMHKVSRVDKPSIIVARIKTFAEHAAPSFRITELALYLTKKHFTQGGILVIAIFIGNIINLIFNAYLGRELDYAAFALIALINSFQYFTTIPFIALAITVNNRTGFLDKRNGEHAAYSFFNSIRNGILFFSIAASIIWLICTPLLMSYFNMENLLPILLFTPIWLTGFIAAANRGFLAGKLLFAKLAIIVITEPAIKLISAFLFINTGIRDLTYVSIPLAIAGAFVISVILISSLKKPSEKIALDAKYKKFPLKFFFVSCLTGLSAMTFLSLDVLLAAHFLPPDEAGQYALISLVGKIVFFLSTLFSFFIMPIVSRNEGAKKDSSNILWLGLCISGILAIASVTGIGIFGGVTVPLLFGEKTYSIIPYLLPFTFAVACFSISSVFVSYYLARKIYSFSVATFMLAIVQIILINTHHSSIQAIVSVMLYVGYANLLIVSILHLSVKYATVIENNVRDLIEVFTTSAGIQSGNNAHILIFNWRDTKHKLAGGAEVYIQEIAKYLVKKGNDVTIFCGNDTHSDRYEVIDGVRIVRRGGFYTVYLWAFIYYAVKFKNKFDIIIDSENGVPFLTPLYVKKPIFLLIHHVHQDVFKNYLPFYMSSIASFVEGKLMPAIYRKKTIITVSNSSKKEIIKLGFAGEENIHVIHPGIDNSLFFKSTKSETPLITYLGRLKPYKNLDILIKAFAGIAAVDASVKLIIAGEGESSTNLHKLAGELGIEKQVEFSGKITEAEKIKLLGRSWVAVQPSQVEGWGITVIEANACGTPVVASNVNGLKDSILDSKTGILINQGDIKKFTEAIHEIIKDTKLRNRLSDEAYNWSRNFSWEQSADKFNDIIQQTDDIKMKLSTSSEFAVRNTELKEVLSE